MCLDKETTIMEGVREIVEEYPVSLVERSDGQFYIEADNEGGYNCTRVNLGQLIFWLKKHKPELLL